MASVSNSFPNRRCGLPMKCSSFLQKSSPLSRGKSTAGHAPNDLEGDVGLVLRPADQLPGIAAVGKDMLNEGEPPPGPLQDALRPVAVLDIGTVNFDREQPAIGVGQNMALAPMDALSGVIAFESPF
jgi:hypothetical protein